ncbi:calcium-binding protein [Tropicibacter naphthalenivorans]|uniref:Cyclolysin n=1 Tax=Tropicibacter naphthalenivorans TaxID=441103 RepID=A0A0P1G5Q2_9RHOB|nr:calcium-binding protein [Tropicibacter naphthalenivorans]CUH77119.1 Cyclolysin [Tropicibacter naphthalenivorans]SMC60586.1 Hemolysin-type calcium-binding repeat-containing protein [Tropicibacter naphthalenivorans]
MATITAGPGNETVIGTPEDDVIFGLDGVTQLILADAGNDEIYGNAGGVRIEGHSGDDTILGGLDDDTILGGGGSDTLDGGLQTGRDVLDYTGEAYALTLTLATGLATVGPDTDRFMGFEEYIGTAFGDTMDGSGVTFGILFNGEGGNDSLVGGRDSDTLIGGASADTLIGGDGDDTLIGGYGDDSIDGGAGVDGALYLGFGGGITVNLSTTTAQATGAAGVDTILNVENLWSGEYNDRITGTTGENFLRLGAGADTVFGLGGADTVFGEAGNDKIQGGAGNDFLSGSFGRDVILGGEDDDFIHGGDDGDQLRGGDGQDVLIGGDGRDVLIGGDFTGGSYPGDGAADVFMFQDVTESAPGGANRDIIRDFEVGLDQIDLSSIDAVVGTSGSAFGFVGTARFSGTAGELRYFTTTASTVVRADVDGDAVADFEVLLNGAMTLSAADFVL